MAGRRHYMLPMRPLPIAVPCLVLLLGACDSSRRAPAAIAATPVYPAAESVDVPRRTQLRVALDRAVDPAALTVHTCQLSADGAFVELDIAFDPATRVLTLTPRRALAPLTRHVARLGPDQRLGAGPSPFAELTWSFTTDAAPVWDRAIELGPGRELALAPSRAGGALALWRDGDQRVLFARWSGGAWTSPRWTGLVHATEAAVADDTLGNVVVAAIERGGSGPTDYLRLARAAAGEAFQAPEAVVPSGFGDAFRGVGVDTVGTHVLVAALHEPRAAAHTTVVRAWRLGAGWAAPFVTEPALPHVQLEASGVGTVVCGFSHFEPIGGVTAAWCERLLVDPFGNVALVDPRPALPNNPALAARTGIDDVGNTLSAQTFPDAWSSGAGTTTHVLRRRANGAWETLPILLGDDVATTGFATGPAGAWVLTSALPGLRPIVWTAAEALWQQGFLGVDEQPAPAAPRTAGVVTGLGRIGALWTAAVDPGGGAAVRLLGAHWPAGGAPGDFVDVEGPFAPEPVHGLRAVAAGGDSAVAIWSRGGAVRATSLR